MFFKMCRLLKAPVTPVFVYDGPRREPLKRGRQVVTRPLWIIENVKSLVKAFGFHSHDVRTIETSSQNSNTKIYNQAPGEAEAELAKMNALGFIDAVITDDSDAVVFGAQCIIRK